MKPFIPFSRYDRKPEYIRQLPREWKLTPDDGDSLVGAVCAICAFGLCVLMMWGIA